MATFIWGSFFKIFVKWLGDLLKNEETVGFLRNQGMKE